MTFPSSIEIEREGERGRERKRERERERETEMWFDQIRWRLKYDIETFSKISFSSSFYRSNKIETTKWAKIATSCKVDQSSE